MQRKTQFLKKKILYKNMGIKFYPSINMTKINYCANTTAQSPHFTAVPPDTFIKESSGIKYSRRLEELFPNGELNLIYDDMCKELNLDYKPTLTFSLDVKNNAGGGYTFHTNTINLSLSSQS